jgi:hypothetical protein
MKLVMGQNGTNECALCIHAEISDYCVKEEDEFRTHQYCDACLEKNGYEMPNDSGVWEYVEQVIEV